jgi:aspartyl/glutamyl-tRNA(Asn/Gln) amidotransferase C subunit
MRDDVVRESLPRKEALRNVPDGTDEFYRVPKIIE